MDTIHFDESKSGQKTCKANGIRLHSAYDPCKEAQRFVSALEFTFEPRMIVVTEPALSYCTEFLRKRFHSAILVAVRYSDQFAAWDDQWDKTLSYKETGRLLDSYGEDMVLAAGFVSWQPSRQAFPLQNEECWKAIRRMMLTARDILGTRAFFGKRWIKNALRFCAGIQETCEIRGGTSPILLAASGPSLTSSLPAIKRNRKRFFLIALSSALEPLRAAGIVPDICISTDGGFWAKKHIFRCTVPLALAAEAALPARLFDGELIPLKYGDGPETELLEACGIPAVAARRNGTVSGTAVELALAITTGPVFACGLDLAAATGFQHCQPNCLEIADAQGDNRTAPKETRLLPPQLPSASLAIYERWFVGQSSRFSPRFYRLANKDYRFSNRLGSIKDIDWEEFETIVSRWEHTRSGATQFPSLHKTTIPPAKTRRERLRKMLLRCKKNPSESWLSALLPAELALVKRGDATEEKIREKSTAIMDELIFFLDTCGDPQGGRDGNAL